MKTTIIVRDFELSCCIGILEHEQKTPQRIRVNVEITVSNDKPISNLKDSFCYMQVKDFIREATKNHIKLVEDLATTIIQHYMNDEKVDAVMVEILKLDVTTDSNGVGVRITDTKS
jgi:dihydroneopterin aldolase